MASLSPSFWSTALDRPPVSWTRVEFNEERLVERGADDTDGVVIAQRFDTPLALDETEAQGGKTGSELKNAALRSRMPFLIDIETWRLPYLANSRDESFGRDVRTVTAQSVPLPLTAEALSDDGVIERLVRASIGAQVGAVRTFAPYFSFTSLEDPWLKANVQCLRATRTIVGDQRLGAWIYVSLDTLLSESLLQVIPRYASELPVGTMVVLTVSDMHPDHSPDVLAKYFRSLEAFANAGLPVTVDRASEASVPAVATYAAGCMLGTRLYRTAPATPNFENNHNPKIRLSYFERRKARHVSRELARKRYSSGRLAKCPHAGCCAVTVTDKKDNVLVRLHNAHDVRYEIRRARRLGAPQLVWSWSDSRYKRLRILAQALELANARSEEA